MKVKVLYFAGAREAVGAVTESVVLDGRTTVAELTDLLLGSHPGLARMKRSLRFSVNSEVVPTGKALKDGDEVGVLPPVAGG